MSPKPASRNPYFWLVVLLPATAVLAGIITLVLALRSDDGLVADDYYKRGLEINRDLRRDRVAAELGLTAQIAAHGDSGTLDVLIQSARNTELPPRLNMHIAHPTRAGHDQTVQLTLTGAGRYRGKLPSLPAGRWYIQIETSDWRITQTWIAG